MDKETLYRYFEGLLTPEEEEAVYRWLDASPSNKEELFREREFFDALILSGSVEDFEGRDEKKQKRIELKIEHGTTLKKKIRTLYAACISAAVCVVILLGVSVYLHYGDTKKEKVWIKQKTDLTSGSDICLVLSDEKQVTFDEKSTDIKYDNKGEIQVNSQIVTEGKEEKRVDREEKKDTKNTPVTYNQLIVPKGKHSTLLLPDGTKLWINAGSHVTFPVAFETDKREIYVDGEIFLEVARNESCPFIVKTNRMQVQVLGTSFNVKSYSIEDTDDVVLVTGSVHVQTESGQKANMVPNQRFLCTSTGKSDIQTVDVYDYICWKDGLLQYKKERFSTILHRLSDYYGKPIAWDPELNDLTCSGKLDLKDDMDKVLIGLIKMIPVKYTKQNESYYFSMNHK